MFRYGLKLWSTNTQYAKHAVSLYDAGRYSFIELFIVPGSLETHLSIWEQLSIPFLLHAPHSLAGLNPARRELESQNLKLAAEVFRFADRLDADKLVFHPGIEGTLEETVRQLSIMADNRIIIENKPYLGIGNVICNGTTPDEIRFIMEKTGVGFCLDLGHAICAANAKSVAPLDYVKEFKSLAPILYHLSDGELEGVLDEHYHLGHGTYDIAALLTDIPEGSQITVETDKDFKDSLVDFERDIIFLNTLLHSTEGRT